MKLWFFFVAKIHQVGASENFIIQIKLKISKKYAIKPSSLMPSLMKEKNVSIELGNAQCTNWPMALKSIVWHILEKYLTTNDPYGIRTQKNFKIRKMYSPDPEFRKFETNFFLKCIVTNIFPETNFSLKCILLWVPFMN